MRAFEDAYLSVYTDDNIAYIYLISQCNTWVSARDQRSYSPAYIRMNVSLDVRSCILGMLMAWFSSINMHKIAADRVREVGVHARMHGVGSEKVLRIRTFEHLNQNKSIQCLGTETLMTATRTPRVDEDAKSSFLGAIFAQKIPLD